MPYKSIRDSIQSYDIAAWDNRGTFFEKAIRFFQGKYTHVGMFKWEGDRLFLAHSWAFIGVIEVKASSFLFNKNFELYRYKGEFSSLETKQRIDDSLGKPYDYKAILQQALYAVTRLYFFPRTKPEAFQCAGFVAYCLQIKDWATVNPNSLITKHNMERIV